MNTRLLEIIQYKTGGKQSEFAEMMGWSPQYLNRLTKGDSSIGLRPVLALLERFPEINARWFLLGEGTMLNSISEGIRNRLIQLLEIEKYMPVMTSEELNEVEKGRTEFPATTLVRWRGLYEERQKEINARFAAAYEKQVELCSKRDKNVQNPCK